MAEEEGGAGREQCSVIAEEEKKIEEGRWCC